MKKLPVGRTAAARLLLAALACGPAAQAAPLVTALPDGSSASASMLVNSLLGPSSGLTVVAGSAQYLGAASASGTFVNGGTNAAAGLGIDAGVVLTTGDARFIGSSAAFAGDDANKSGTFTSGVGNALTVNTSGGHALFDAMTPLGTTNASVLSFRFVPQQGTLTLSLAFGSEDYNDIVNTGFPTDVFGVFVNGVNHALVPGTLVPISAASVNGGGPTSGPASGIGAQNAALYRDNAPFFGFIDSELDGITTVFNLRIAVNPGQENTILIGVADAMDGFGDSAVLLRAGSIAAVPEPSSYALMLAGIAAISMLARRRRPGRGLAGPCAS